MKKQPAIREAEVIRAVGEYLSVRRIPYWRNNTGAYKEGKRFIRYGITGSSDFIGICPDGRFLAVECKRPATGVLSAAQREFLDLINRKLFFIYEKQQGRNCTGTRYGLKSTCL